MTTTKRDILKAIANRTHAIANAVIIRGAAYVESILDHMDDLISDMAWCEEQIAYVDSEFTNGGLSWVAYDEYTTSYEQSIKVNSAKVSELRNHIRFSMHMVEGFRD